MTLNLTIVVTLPDGHCTGFVKPIGQSTMARETGEVQTPKVALADLSRPEKLQNALKGDLKDDCLSCRLTGG